MSFQIPAGTVGIALAMFGITGVGADEMTTYTYWCLEKGYARWTGPDDGTDRSPSDNPNDWVAETVDPNDWAERLGATQDPAGGHVNSHGKESCTTRTAARRPGGGAVLRRRPAV
ncbi:hypothetical protein [Streptomyces sp. BRA346]|uniref:hypothetical protein n=1 Tax=Streptomyces sp. BRA346 TaxID=2878199 RepID=UPI00406422F2